MYNQEKNTYELTRWPSPVDGFLMNSGYTYTTYNLVEFELLKPYVANKKNIDFFKKHNYTYPDLKLQKNYVHSLVPKVGSMRVYLNGQILTENIDYIYNLNLKSIQLNNKTIKDTIKLLSCSYIPLDNTWLYEDINTLTRKSQGVFLKKIPSPHIHSLISFCRKAIEDLYIFVKLDTPLWIGGAFNQSFGSDNIIKYVTPVIHQHINEIIEKFDFFSYYVSNTFSGFSATLPNSLTEKDKLENEAIRNILIAINQAESYVNELLTNPSNMGALNVTI